MVSYYSALKTMLKFLLLNVAFISYKVTIWDSGKSHLTSPLKGKGKIPTHEGKYTIHHYLGQIRLLLSPSNQPSHYISFFLS